MLLQGIKGQTKQMQKEEAVAAVEEDDDGEEEKEEGEEQTHKQTLFSMGSELVMQVHPYCPISP